MTSSVAPQPFAWSLIERFGKRDGTRLRAMVRARCACGVVRVMTASDFDNRRRLCCSACRMRRARASGYAGARLRRVRGRVHTWGAP